MQFSLEKNNLVKGDFQKVQDEVYRLGLNKLSDKFSGVEPYVRKICVSDIEPAPNQRDTSLFQALKLLKKMNGWHPGLAGPVSVRPHPTEPNKWECWNGMHRVYMALLAMGPSYHILAIVDDLKSIEETAESFAYTQKTGQNSMSQEAFFGNEYLAKNKEVLALGEVLENLGYKIPLNKNISIPPSAKDTDREIKVSGLKFLDRIFGLTKRLDSPFDFKSNLSVADRMIQKAFPDERVVNVELLAMLTLIIDSYPFVGDNTKIIHNVIQEVLDKAYLKGNQAQLVRDIKVSTKYAQDNVLSAFNMMDKNNIYRLVPAFVQFVREDKSFSKHPKYSTIKEHLVRGVSEKLITV